MTLPRKQFGAVAIGLAALFSAAQAQALDVKCDYSQAEISSGMKAEGQKPLVIADKLLVNSNNPIQLFTSDKDGNGYILQGNQPSAKASTSFCVAMKLSGIRLYDARKKDIPASAFRGGKLDEALLAGQKNGQNVFLQANAVNANDQVTGTVITVGGSYSEGDGIMIFAKDKSEVKVMAGFEGIKYSAEALAILNQPFQTASLNPK